MPVQHMHAGEEILYVVIPLFVVLMVIDMIKRRKLRRQAEDGPSEDSPAPQDEVTEDKPTPAP